MRKLFGLLLLLVLASCGLPVAPLEPRDDKCVYVRERVKDGSISLESAYYWFPECAPFAFVSTRGNNT